MKKLAALLALAAPLYAGALSFSNRYRSPRNPERQFRKSTSLIVLHTTEAGGRSSLNKLSERGEAHYCIDEKGVVYRIVDRNREAFHAGRSMWCGREECDSYSIGIEVVGHHDKPVTLAQLDSLRDLVAMLKKEYRIDDAHVVCHSHVAYGAPNKWQKRNHRGRKRCGMLFAMPSVRSRLGLRAKPAYDPDVRARRLVVGDRYLESVLYGRVDTMAGKLGRNVEPEGGGLLATFFSKRRTAPQEKKPSESSAPAAKPAARSPAPSPPPEAKPAAAKAASPAAPAQKPAAAAAKPAASGPAWPALSDLEDRMHFREVGVLGKNTSPYKLCGKGWNSATTFYCLKGRVVRGDSFDPKKAKPGTRVFMRK